MSELRVGIRAPLQHPWPSVERTRQFFFEALEQAFDVELVGRNAEPYGSNGIAAMLNFATQEGWDELTPEAPNMMTMLGGPVLNRAFIRDKLSDLRARDVLLVNCSSDIQILTEMCNGPTPQMVVIPLPVDEKVFKPQDQAQCRLFTGTSEFKYVVGYVARLLPQKNLHGYLRQLAALRSLLAPLKVGGLIVGNFWQDYPCLPYETEMYANTIQSLVEQLGLDDIVLYPASLTDEELAQCYASMDVLYHPTMSIDENFGLVPIEAMSCGIPVVATAYGGLKDTVIDGETGFLMKSWVTPSGIRMDTRYGRQALAKILLDEPLRSALSQYGIARVRRHYSRKRCAAILQSSVSEAIRNYNKLPPAKLHVKTEASSERSLLPKTSPDWADYIPSVRHYVSDETPSCGSESLFSVAGPLRLIREGRYRLEDPAWPAAFDVTATEHAALDRMEEWFSEQAIAKAGITTNRLQHWLSEGLLTHSKAGLNPVGVSPNRHSSLGELCSG